MYGTCENKCVVVLLCAVMSGQLGPGKGRCGQRLERCAACFYFGWMNGQMKKVVNERTSGLLFGTCLLLGALGASETVTVIDIVATMKIQMWKALRGQYNIDARLQ